MLINGKEIAAKITTSLEQKTSLLKSKGIIPGLAVVLVGSDKSSLTYVTQKKKLAAGLGVSFQLHNLNPNTPKNVLFSLVSRLNQRSNVNGIIIQRPVPLPIPAEKLNLLVSPEKDVDGFHPQSLFDPPVALAVVEIMKYVYKKTLVKKNSFLNWLKKKNILVIGRGETAGKPIAKYFTKKNIPFSVAHSQTADIKKLCLASDIIIPCVGRPNIVRHNMISSKTILIGVGLHPEEDNKLRADYDQKEISQKAAFYTPVPRGVGPVNVTLLFKNTLEAASLTKIF